MSKQVPLNKAVNEVTELEKVLTLPHTIPKYQRNYDWGKKQCEDLFNDLRRFHDDKKDDSIYMLGQIVSYRTENGELFVLDGQQRLVTTSLFVAAFNKIANLVLKYNSNADQSFIKKVSRWATDTSRLLMDDEDVAHLTLFKDNISVYDRIITGKREFISKKELDSKSKINLCSNYDFFFTSISKYMGIEQDSYGYVKDSDFCGKIDGFERAIELLRTLLDFKVCTIYCVHLSEAYDLFVSINNRGIQLTALDLLKNHVYCRCYSSDESLRDDNYDIEDKWDVMLSKLDALKSKEADSKFLRYYARATIGAVSDSNVFETIMRCISTEEEAVKFIAEFTDVLEFARLATDSNYAVGITPETKHLFMCLKLYGFTSYMPMAISVYLKHKDSPDLDSALRSILKEYDRFYVLGVLPHTVKTGDIEDDTSKHAVAYYKGETDLDGVIGAVHKEVVLDDSVKTALINHNWSNNLAKGVLSQLYEKTSRTTLVDYNKIQAEHIMPQTISEVYWPDVTDEEHSNCCKKIGNIILLRSKINGSISNHGFIEKKTWYRTGGPDPDGKSNPQYVDTAADLVINSDEWGPEEIKTRTGKLVDMIIKEWS